MPVSHALTLPAVVAAACSFVLHLACVAFRSRGMCVEVVLVSGFNYTCDLCVCMMGADVQKTAMSSAFSPFVLVCFYRGNQRRAE